MDWDSPTTKKHIAEAKAQGCELLGLGRRTKSQVYRVYRLPCGHEKEMQIGDMRMGRVRCPTCLDNKLKEEATAQGCELLGSGKDSGFRSYRLPCGHEQEVQPAKMRTGGFGCKTCVNNKLTTEAEAQKCVLLGEGDNNRSRMYQLECGHEQSIETRNIRAGQFKCQTCFHNELSASAEAQGCELLGKGRTKDYRSYRLPCGHEQETQPGAMLVGRFRCQICLNNNLKIDAIAQGCRLLDEGSNCHNRLYSLPCGHEQEIETGNMRRGEGWFECQICRRNKLDGEAIAQGCVLLGPVEDPNYRLYRLPCGHEQEITLNSMRLNNYRCHTCEEWAFTQPSQAYLLHIKTGPDEWLKLGFAKNIDFRVSQYGLPSDTVVSVVTTKQFKTGKEAQVFEKGLHKKHRRKRLKAVIMADFHSKSGQTECYPVIMVDRLMAEFRQHSTK